ncbi:hydroxylase [Mobiluncus mulieris]|uniref:Hydroxylase n=1 Tax=Mobiluncus mulieris TaxID=2052 RepID=A0A7Y0U4Y3_9ACTO|nr:hydroxylase [Mobiluncus mulieris]MCU9970861.1 hydroxylase [Mobiluncus mulieris]MCU9972751.1 hydroxylase [Mobiluncus mulieris]MCU9995524.1 hydroxylase [Mobiluncus mulieris]NMW59718.1 hydroxylase [Mobiluncus mulieris]
MGRATRRKSVFIVPFHHNPGFLPSFTGFILYPRRKYGIFQGGASTILSLTPIFSQISATARWPYWSTIAKIA